MKNLQNNTKMHDGKKNIRAREWAKKICPPRGKISVPSQEHRPHGADTHAGDPPTQRPPT